MVEPEVVATSPCRIKSPGPVYCGFGSESGAHGRIRTRTGDALDVVPLLVGLRERRMVRASGNAPEPGTDLVRFRL